MRRMVTTALSLLALDGVALAADLPPPPQLPPVQAQPVWTGFYAGLNVGGAFGSSRNAFSIAGFGLPTFNTSLDGRRSGAARPVTTGRRVPGSSGSKPTSREAGSAAPAPRPASRLSAGRWRRATSRAVLVRNAAAAGRLCARELALLRHGRRRSRRGRRGRDRDGRLTCRCRQSQPDANRLDARRRRRGRACARLERQSRISLCRSGQPHDDVSLVPADLEYVAPQCQCGHRRRELPLLIDRSLPPNPDLERTARLLC